MIRLALVLALLAMAQGCADCPPDVAAECYDIGHARGMQCQDSAMLQAVHPGTVCADIGPECVDCCREAMRLGTLDGYADAECFVVLP